MNISQAFDPSRSFKFRNDIATFPVYRPTHTESWMTVRYHPDSRPKALPYIPPAPALAPAGNTKKSSPCRDWILAALRKHPDGLTGYEIRRGAKMYKGCFDAMYLTLMRTGDIEICGFRKPIEGGRTARIYRLVKK